jgi:ACS family glucarate transporter-like MFS transporter
MALAGVWLGTSETWRPVFILYALAGFAWAALFWLWFRDEPRQHSGVNPAEIALVEGNVHGEQHIPIHAVGAIPFRQMVTNRSIQLLALAAVCVNVGWIFAVTWLPTYLIEVHDADPKWAGFYTSLTAASGMAGCLAGGLGTDWLLHRIGLPWARRIPGMLAYGGAGLGCIICWTLDDMHAIVAVLVVCSFLSDFALGSIWASFQDIGAAPCSAGRTCAATWPPRVPSRSSPGSKSTAAGRPCSSWPQAPTSSARRPGGSSTHGKRSVLQARKPRGPTQSSTREAIDRPAIAA